AKGSLQPAVFVSGRKQPRSRLVNRLEDPKLGFELLDDDDRSALELELRDPAAQLIDLEQVFVHDSSVFKNRRNGQPVNQPVSSGATTGISPRTIISRWAARVTRSTARPYSGWAVPSIRPLISRNCRRTSTTTWPAARPTASMLSEPNRNGRMPPKKSPTITSGSVRSKARCAPRPTSSVYEEKSTSAASPAEPIA